jgi:hypothetical protein
LLSLQSNSSEVRVEYKGFGRQEVAAETGQERRPERSFLAAEAINEHLGLNEWQ